MVLLRLFALQRAHGKQSPNPVQKNFFSFNYAKLRIASIPVFIIISLVMVFLCQTKKYFITKEAKKTDFYQLYNFLKYILISGIVMMLLGFAFFDYHIEGVMLYGVYTVYVFVVGYLLLAVYKDGVYNRFYEVIPYILVSGVIIYVSFKFVDFPVIGTLIIYYYGVLLIPMMFYKKYGVFYFLVFCLYLYGSILTYVGGKELIQIVFVLVGTFMLSYSKITKIYYPTRVKWAKFFFILFALSLPSLLVYMEFVASSSDRSNLVHKLHSIQTMIGFLLGFNDLYDVDDSPLTRMAQFANIMYENLHNPLFLIFGRGFGGYYSDSLNLMGGLEIATGNNISQLASGKYYYAHDAYVSVPFVSGLIGVVLWIKCIWRYLKNAPFNYFKLMSIPFLVMTFFFDTQIGVIGVVMLYASEKRIEEVG